jgi:predicted nucleic acid-binding protein
VIFVDAWAWVAMADEDDQHHAVAIRQNRHFERIREHYATTDFVLAEAITLLFRDAPFRTASRFIARVLQLCRRGHHRLINVTPLHFDRAWQLRLKYDDKPDISFVDFTSMVVMQELGIDTVFTGDGHFEQVNLGFRLVP